MIKQDSRSYFAALGAHVSLLRKTRGMTQAELAREIGVSQQAVFAYELGERRISVLVLTRLAKIFRLSLDELAGMSRPATNRSKLSPRTLRHAQRMQSLPVTQQRFMLRILGMLEESNKK